MSYLELLAENDSLARQEYDENAKDLLVQHNEYDETVEAHDHHPDELEDQDAFKHFGGSHTQAGMPAPLKDYEHGSKTSIFHDKHVRTHVINVDSRFRASSSRSSTDFLFVLNRPMKNVMSVRVSSIELPNTYYTFSKVRGNTSFNVKIGTNVYPITIPDGNYTPQQMVSSLNMVFTAVVPSAGLIASWFETSALLYIYSTTTTFDIDFEPPTNNFSARSTDWGLGYALGFRTRNLPDNTVTPVRNTITQYTNSGPYNITNKIIALAKSCYIGSSILDTLDANYLMLTLDHDWKVVCNYAPDRTQHYSFMKIIMTSGKYAVLFDNGANTITKEYVFNQPTNLSAFPVRLSDPYDQTIDLNGMEFSFTMEIKEILDSSLYESIRSS
jgi:hypothetical protein